VLGHVRSTWNTDGRVKTGQFIDLKNTLPVPENPSKFPLLIVLGAVIFKKCLPPLPKMCCRPFHLAQNSFAEPFISNLKLQV
jgi:hypothetical protein